MIVVSVESIMNESTRVYRNRVAVVGFMVVGRRCWTGSTRGSGRDGALYGDARVWPIFDLECCFALDLVGAI